MKEEEIKPCPFCGGKAYVYQGMYPWVECEDCCGRNGTSETVEEAIENWNDRGE